MVCKLYLTVSPGCRAVLMTAKAIGVKLEEHPVDLAKGEHLSDNFIKMNPQHTVPTLDDNGFIIWDSHAILAYLVNKYAKGSSLYPKDCERQAIVDQRLHFDSGVLFPILFNVAVSFKMGLIKTIPDDKKKLADDAFNILNTFLSCNEWVAGSEVTIADFSLIATVRNMDLFFSVESYSNIVSWVKRCEELPCYAENKPGLESFREFYEKFL